jgi:hypothetical protein
MNIEKLKNVINDSDELKKMIFFYYIRDYLKELTSDNNILYVDDKKSSINFLNYKSYKLSYKKPVEESIDEFEALMPTYREYSIKINGILNNNINDFKNHLIKLQEDLKIKYFHCRHIEFLLSRDDYNKQELALRIFIEDRNLNLQIPINDFWIYNNKNYDSILDKLVKDTLKIKIIAQLESIEGMSNYKIVISDNQTKLVEITIKY